MVSLPNIFMPDDFEEKRRRLLNWYFMDLDEGIFADADADWNFAGNLDLTGNPGPTFSVTRASGNASYFDSSGVLQIEAINNIPRFTHDSVTLKSLGVMIEDARINNALWCRDGTNAAWVKSNITPVKDATGLDGVSSSATTLTATAGNGTMLQTVTIVSAAFTTSFWVKRKTGTGNIDITDDNGGNWTTLTGLSSSVWTRYEIVRTQANPVFGFRIVTSGDEIEFDFAQLESGAMGSSPIPTTTTAVTRATERINTADVTWYNTLGGTFYCEFRLAYGIDSTARYAFSLNNGINNAVMMFGDGSNTYSRVRFGGSSVASLAHSGVAEDTDYKQAMNFAANDFASSRDASALVTDTSGAIPTTPRMEIGTANSGSSQILFGTVARLVYFPPGKSGAFLQEVTA